MAVVSPWSSATTCGRIDRRVLAWDLQGNSVMAKKDTASRAYKVRRMSGDILTARPEGMDYETYRQKRKEQSAKLKERLKGFMVWKSKAYMLRGESWGTLKGKVPALRFED